MPEQGLIEFDGKLYAQAGGSAITIDDTAVTPLGVMADDGELADSVRVSTGGLLAAGEATVGP